jgi:hypothetical protein
VVEAHHPKRPSDDRRPGIPELPMPPSCSAAGASPSLPQPPMRAIFCPSAAAIAIRERQMATIDTHRAAEAPVSRSPTSLMSPLLNSFSDRVLG